MNKKEKNCLKLDKKNIKSYSDRRIYSEGAPDFFIAFFRAFSRFVSNPAAYGSF